MLLSNVYKGCVLPAIGGVTACKLNRVPDNEFYCWLANCLVYSEAIIQSIKTPVGKENLGSSGMFGFVRANRFLNLFWSSILSLKKDSYSNFLILDLIVTIVVLNCPSSTSQKSVAYATLLQLST